jgi:hypothetical protein
VASHLANVQPTGSDFGGRTHPMVTSLTLTLVALERAPTPTVKDMTRVEPLAAATLTITEVAARTGLSADTAEQRRGGDTTVAERLTQLPQAPASG